MLDGSEGPARLVFASGDGPRHVARLGQWLVIARFQPPPGAPPGSPGCQRSFTAAGVFGAAGIVDAARVHVRAGRLRRRVRLRLSADAEMRDPAADPELTDDNARADCLTITASGAVQPLEPRAIEPWQ